MSDSYQSLFIETLQDALTECMAKVQHSGYLLPNELREEAWHLLSYAFRYPEIWQQTRELLLDISPKMEMAGFRDDWMMYLECGLKECAVIEDTAAKARIYTWLAHICELRGSYQKAFEFFAQSALTYEFIGDLHQCAKVLCWQAYVARLMGNYQSTSLLLDKANSYFEENDINRFDYHISLGWLEFDRNNQLVAFTHFRTAFDLATASKNQRVVYKALRGMATTCFKQNDYGQAYKLWNQAIELARMFQDMSEQAILEMNIGTVYLITGNVGKAINSFTFSESTFQKNQDIYNLAMVSHNMGLAYRALSAYQDSINAFQRSVFLCDEIGDFVLLTDTLNELGNTYLIQKQFVEAKSTLDKAISLLAHIHDDSIYALRQSELASTLSEVEAKSLMRC